MARIFLAALLLTTLTGCFEGISRQVLATVLALRGQPAVAPHQRTEFRAVTADSTFGRGTIFRTGPAAELDLILVPGILARLLGNSELQIDRLELVKDGNETQGGMISRTARVRLLRGRLIVSCEDVYTTRTQSRLMIETSRISLTSNAATLIRVETTDAETRVICGLGTVYPSDTNDSLPEGYFRVWPAKTQQSLPATEDPKTHTDLASTVKAGEELRQEREQNLPRANRFPRP